MAEYTLFLYPLDSAAFLGILGNFMESYPLILMVIFSCLYGSTFSSDDGEELDDPFGTLGLPLSEPPGSPPLSELFEDSDDDELFLDEGLDDGGFPNECSIF
jgi:hypothetical protein